MIDIHLCDISVSFSEMKCTYYYLDNNQCIYTWEDSEWMMKGQYEHAMRKNEELVWSKNGEHIAQILIVSIFNLLSRINIFIY